MDNQSSLEDDIKQAFPGEYTAEDWPDLVEKYVEMLAKQEVEAMQETERRINEYMESFAPGEPPAPHMPNYKLIRASAWLETKRWQSFPLLAYQIALLRHKISLYDTMQEQMNDNRARLEEIEATLKSNADASFKAERPN